jgi:hypothetical protein
MRRATRWVSVASLVLLSAVVLVACSGDSPVAPSSTAQGVVFRGMVLGAGVSSSSGMASVASSAAAVGEIIVTVQENPAITTTVGADGSFALRGLPSGSFTLVFTRDGAVLGEIVFDAVKPNQEITITIDVSTGIVVVVEERRDGIGHGDIEIEGLVEQVVGLNAAADSTFLIDGHTVIARPGQTAIREGNMAKTVADVTVGRQVHVKGVFLDPVNGVEQVLAHEIKLQGDDEEEDGGGTTGCNISGGRVGSGIELEGNVSGGNATSFDLDVKGNRALAPVDVDAGGAAFECHPKSGPNAPSPEQCRAKVTSGAQVHVSGMLTACTSSSANVRASKVIVQK